ncbi:unnamed protein product, partial [Rotaria sp. Silwood1]
MAVIDLTKSDALWHGKWQTWLEPILESIDTNLDYSIPVAPFRQHQWVAETDNSETEHIVQKRCVHGCRSSRQHHHHHRPLTNQYHGSWPNQYPGPLANQYPGSWPNQYPGPLANQYPGSWSNQYPGSWSNQYPGSWSNQYPGSWSNQNPIGIPYLQPRYRRSLSVFDDNKGSKNFANDREQWRVEQKFADRSRGFAETHQ